MALAVANRYAAALADIVLDEASGLDPVEAVPKLRAMAELVNESAELRTILLNPAVAPARKQAVVSRLSELLGLPVLLRNFIFVLMNRRRIGALNDISQAFEDILDERLGRLRADVTFAGRFNEEQRVKLRDELSQLTGKQVRCEFSEQPELLGGAVVQAGSTVYDGSIRGQLEALRQRLVK